MVPGRIRSGSGPMACLLAAYRPGQPPGTPSSAAMPNRVWPAVMAYRCADAQPGNTSMVPGRIRPGSGPMACLLAAYSAGQPPGTPRAAAMPDSVSPGRTTYRAAAPAGMAAWTAAAAGLTGRAAVSLVFVAMRVAAWAGRTGPLRLAAATITVSSSRPQASTAHADFVHARKVLSLSFLRNQRRTTARRRDGEPAGKESDLRRGNLRQVATPDRRGGSPPRQAYDQQHGQRRHGAAEHPGTAAAAGTRHPGHAARATAGHAGADGTRGSTGAAGPAGCDHTPPPAAPAPAADELAACSSRVIPGSPAAAVWPAGPARPSPPCRKDSGNSGARHAKDRRRRHLGDAGQAGVTVLVTGASVPVTADSSG